MNEDIKVPEVVFMRDSTDSRYTGKSISVSSFSLAQHLTYGSAIRRSVSLMIRFGSAILLLVLALV